MATARSGPDPLRGVDARARVRPPRPDELERLRAVERAAGRAFADVGLPGIAADEPFSVAELERFRRVGLAWVVTTGGDDRDGDGGSGREEVAGYVLVELLDHPLASDGGAAAHIEQVSVDPAHAHRRLGARLIDHVAAEARGRGLAHVTLTTFRDVPWNAPYYERCGFRTLDEAELGAGLRRVRAAEAVLGLDPALRVCMHRPT